MGRLDWECIGGELVKEIQGAELIRSKGNSNLVPRLNHRCLHFVVYPTVQKIQSKKQKKEHRAEAVEGKYTRRGIQLYGLSRESVIC